MNRRWGIAFVLAAATLSVSAAELPEGYRLEPVVPSGITAPSALAIGGDGRIFIAERTTGNVRVVYQGELLATPACTIGVTATGEGGLLGLAAHPNFALNGLLYAYYTSAAGTNKVTRYSMSGNSCTNPVDILAGLGAGPSFLRNGGGLAFGSDGKLYVATGDFETSADAQNGASLAGKVLRLNDDGSIPADNPTLGSAVWSKGYCNGRGLAGNGSGNMYMLDRGWDPSVYDELNTAKSNGNYGWDPRTGNSGGLYDDPLDQWLATVGVQGLTVYGANAFLDRAADGKDSDHDKFGVDHLPGRARLDDNGGKGECIGSVNYGQTCTSNANCPARNNGFYNETAKCETLDDLAEYCTGGVPAPGSDDACGSSGTAGVDEADETTVNNLFFAAGVTNKIMRAVLKPGALDQLSTTKTFLDSNFLADCPDNWVAVATGRDGWLYALASNTGGAAGGLYRVIYDATPGPREVSARGSHFPLRVDKSGGSTNDVVISWEDTRSDATQPRDDGNADPNLRQPLQPVREFTLWQGTLGTWYSHATVAGFDKTQGTAVNDALRRATITAGPDSYYFLVSGRHANLEGTLGKRSDSTERPGYAQANICQTIGFHGSPAYDLWKCGQDFTVKDEFGETRSLYEYREQVVMIDLSAIWCPPCIAEANVLENVWQLYKDRGVRFLTLLMDEDDQLWDWAGRPTAAECRNWSDRPGTSPDHTFPCWMDPVGVGPQKAWPLYNKYGAIPTNVVLDTGLRVVYSGPGYDEATIKDKLDRLVGSADACLQ